MMNIVVWLKKITSHFRPFKDLGRSPFEKGDFSAERFQKDALNE